MDTPAFDTVGTGASIATVRQQHQQQQQQQRPLNLMQCTDRKGNIDAFLYIAYSKQRRINFLKRATFICKMKSSLQQQRALSLPGMTMTTTSVPIVLSNTAAGATGTNSVAFWETMKNLSRRKSLGLSGDGIMSRSSSIPLANSFVVNRTLSTVATGNKSNNNNDSNAAAAVATTNSAADDDDDDIVVTTTQPQPSTTKRRQLRREEFEAAEALLFSIGRDIGSSSSSSSSLEKNTVANRRNDNSLSSSSDEDEQKNNNENGIHCSDSTSTTMSKKRKISTSIVSDSNNNERDKALASTEENILDLIKYTKKKKKEKEYDIDINSHVSRQPTRE